MADRDRTGRRGRRRREDADRPERGRSGWDWPDPDAYTVSGPDVPLKPRRARDRQDTGLDLPTFVVEPGISADVMDAYPFAEPPRGWQPGEDPFPDAPRTMEAFGTMPTPAAAAPIAPAAPAAAAPAPEAWPAGLGPVHDPDEPVEAPPLPAEHVPDLPHHADVYHPTAADLPTGEGEAEAVAATDRRLVRNTAIFSVATGLSRIAGLVREVVASSYFGTTGPASAFTLAFQVPNLVRGLVADAALSAAFVPVFTDLLEQKRRREAAALATTLLFYIVAGLAAITAFFILAAGVIMPLFIGHDLAPYTDLVVGLSQVLFPIVLLLGVNGLVVGILNAYDHFAIPAIAPLVWNMVIIAALVALHGSFHGENQIYAYAIGVLIGTVVQLGMALPVLRRVGFHFSPKVNLRDPRVKQVFVLMLPVTIALGVINFDLLINSFLGGSVSEAAPRAIDAAFRVYMLPQGMVSVALATVLFPALSRLASRRDLDGLRSMLATGSRQIYFCLIPAAAFCIVLATPIIQLVYQRGEFDAQSTKDTATALFWFSFSLPFAGVNLLLTRAFFSLQRPWYPTALAAISLVVNLIVSLALYKPLGIAGVVIGTAVASAVMTVQQMYGLRKLLNGRLEVGETVGAVVRICIASAALGGAAWLVWDGLASALGHSLPAQIISVGMAALVGLVVYVLVARLLRIREMQQIENIINARRGRGRAAAG